MLHEAISEISGQEIPDVNDTQIDLPINAFIPATWILNREEKLEAYKSATECSNNNELTELATDWVNRYGNLPKPVESLIMIMRLKLLSKKCGFNKIKLKKPNILIETKLKNMFPSLKFIVAHGQMNETELENAMIAFNNGDCLLYTSPSPRDLSTSRMPSSA